MRAPTVPQRTTLERTVAATVRATLRTPLRSATLAVLRGAGRRRPAWRCVSAPIAYASEALGDEPGIITSTLSTGARITLLARDAMHRHIYFCGVYEAATTRFVESVGHLSWTFLDVGANAGYYSLLAADLGGTGAKVFAFEPNPTLVGLLLASADLHPATIVVSPLACGATAGAAQLRLSHEPGNSGLSTLRDDVLPATVQTLTVAVVTLDGFCEERGIRPEVIKVDVEGNELSVLQGASGLLAAKVPRFVICEHVPDRIGMEDPLQFMAAMGYVARSLDDAGRLIPFVRKDFQNVVYEPGDAPVGPA